MSSETNENSTDVLYTQLWSQLDYEIGNLKETLASVERDCNLSLDNITEHTRDIANVVQAIVDNNLDARKQVPKNISLDMGSFPNPIYSLVCVSSLTRAQIPLDVVKFLISAGFDMNHTANDYYVHYISSTTCLYKAIQNQHFNIVKLLMQHGAKCCYTEYDCDIAYEREINYSYDYNPHCKSLITLLAKQPNVPLDLIDMLSKRSGNLVDPLCAAVTAGHSGTALHLIKLGASIDTRIAGSRLPIHYLIDNCNKQDNDDLFFHLIPAQSLDIVSVIYDILERKKCSENLMEILHQLVQRLHFAQLKVAIEIWDTPFGGKMIRLTMNGKEIAMWDRREAKLHSWKALYLISSVLLGLHFNVTFPSNSVISMVLASAPEQIVMYAKATDDAWATFHQNSKVKPLVTLSILQIRHSMNSLDDKSFVSLCIPPYIHRILTCRDVSDIVCKEWLKTDNKTKLS